MELFRLLGTIAVDNSRANEALDETARQAGATGDEVSTAVNKIGSVAGGLVKAFAMTGAAIGGAWIAAIESTREYRTEMGKLDTAFEASGHSSETAKKTYSELNAVLGGSGQAVEAAQHLAKLTDNEKDLQTWTDICTGVYATFGESIPIESLTESANEVAKSGELTGGLVDALVWAGIGEEDFQKKLDACTSEQERQKLIMDTLNGTYSEASEQYKKNNKDVMDAQKAQEKLTDAFAELGRIGEPILTLIKTKVADMVAGAIPHLENFVNKVKDVANWVKNNKDTVDKWVAVIIGAGVSIGTFLLILNWGTIMTAAANAVKTVRLAILALNTALRANPIGFVVSLIAGLVAAFIYLWNNNEGFRKFWLNMWEKIKSATSTVISAVKNKFNDLQAGFNKVKTVFSNIQKTISEKMESARKKVKDVIDKIKGFFNISLKFKGLKMPSISLSMQKGKGLAQKAAELLGLSGVPKFSVKWNAEGGILTKATIFGMGKNGQLLGGGEAGDEAVAPIALLQDYIAAAVQQENNTLAKVLVEQNQALMAFLARIVPSVVRLDTGALVGALAPALDVKLSDRWEHSKRGNTR